MATVLTEKTEMTDAMTELEGFGFVPEAATHHFRVHVPATAGRDVAISEHFTFTTENAKDTGSLSDAHDGQLKIMLSRSKWNAMAEEVRAELNRRLKTAGLKPSKWKTGVNYVSRLLGKELMLLAWAIEDADPATIPTAIRNWLGLQPEERWWLYTMTNAATGHAVSGRNRGWRKAVRFALTENPVPDNPRRAYLEDLDASQRASQEALSLFRVLDQENAGVAEEIVPGQKVDYPKPARRRTSKSDI